MRTRTTGPLPAALRGMQRRFQQWRRSRQGRSRIPPHLWTAAVRAAARYGLCRTARTLGLDYTALQRRVAVGEEGAAQAGRGGGLADPPGVGGATFVELPGIGPGGGCECVLEWEDPGGARMRVHLKDAHPAHLAALSRSLWSAGA